MVVGHRARRAMSLQEAICMTTTLRTAVLAAALVVLLVPVTASARITVLVGDDFEGSDLSFE